MHANARGLQQREGHIRCCGLNALRTFDQRRPIGGNLPRLSPTENAAARLWLPPHPPGRLLRPGPWNERRLDHRRLESFRGLVGKTPHRLEHPGLIPRRNLHQQVQVLRQASWAKQPLQQRRRAANESVPVTRQGLESLDDFVGLFFQIHNGLQDASHTRASGSQRQAHLRPASAARALARSVAGSQRPAAASPTHRRSRHLFPRRSQAVRRLEEL